MLHTINVLAGTATFDPKGVKNAIEPAASVYHLGSKEDVAALATTELIEVFNTIVKSQPDLGVREVNRFSTREVANNRLWGLLVSLKALAGHGEPDEPKLKKARAKTVKEAKTSAPKTKAPAKEKTAPGPRKLKDKDVKPGQKQHEPREGTMQRHAFDLVSRRGGISVDDYVKEMNAKKRAKYTRSNAWSSLCYILNRNHGFGLRCKDEVFTIWDGKHNSH